jgi:hypothetical protein
LQGSKPSGHGLLAGTIARLARLWRFGQGHCLLVSLPQLVKRHGVAAAVWVVYAAKFSPPSFDFGRVGSSWQLQLGKRIFHNNPHPNWNDLHSTFKVNPSAIKANTDAAKVPSQRAACSASSLSRSTFIGAQTVDELQQVRLGRWDVGLFDLNLLLFAAKQIHQLVTRGPGQRTCGRVALGAGTSYQITTHKTLHLHQ